MSLTPEAESYNKKKKAVQDLRADYRHNANGRDDKPESFPHSFFLSEANRITKDWPWDYFIAALEDTQQSGTPKGLRELILEVAAVRFPKADLSYWKSLEQPPPNDGKGITIGGVPLTGA